MSAIFAMLRFERKKRLAFTCKYFILTLTRTLCTYRYSYNQNLYNFTSFVIYLSSISIIKEEPESDENNSFDHGPSDGSITDKPIIKLKLQNPANQCKGCPRRYSNEEQHMVLHSIKSEYVCSICDTNFVSLSDQQNHERRSHKVKNIHCPDCPATFYSMYHLKRHRPTHSLGRTIVSKSVQPSLEPKQGPKMQYLCKLCQRRYKNKERHMVKFHSVRTEFVCSTCNISFTSLSEQQTHERGVHRVKNMHCTECSASFYSNYHLKRHSLKHSSGGETFECDICRAAFKSRENIRLHMAIHINARRYKCTLCNKDFNYRTQLTQHMRVHSAICPYQCETCGKSFKSNGSLKLHRNTHVGDKPYKCERCEKAYTTLMNLQLHTRTHTGDKPYVCGVCSRPFHDASTLRTHRRLHSGERPFVCHICGKATKQAGGLRSHYRKFHKVNDITNQMIRQNAKALADKKRSEVSTELQHLGTT